MRWRKRTLPMVGLIAFVVAVLVASPFSQREPLLSPGYWSAMLDLGRLVRLVQTQNLDHNVNYDTLREAATSGILQTLDDPYARRLDRSDLTDFLQDTSQRYVGIGIELQVLEGRVVVSRVFPNSPAAEGDLLPGDRILSADLTDLTNANIGQVVEALRGPVGSRVTVRVRQPDEESRVVTLERRAVVATTVRDAELREDGIGYVKVTSFAERTGEELETILRDFESRGMERFVLDLRDNPGGLLTAAVDVAGLFLEPGSVVVKTQGRGRFDGREKVYNAEYHAPRTYPVAVLINRRSASASEVVAGALQDAGRAVIVGETSVGKGTIQTIRAFPDGTGFKQTTAVYLTPQGRSIDGAGVTPDVEVPVDLSTYRQLLLQKRHARVLSPQERAAAFGEEVTDVQLDAAVEALLRS